MYRYILSFVIILIGLASCSDNEPTLDIFEPPHYDIPENPPTSEKPLRILAIGNSFTSNATQYIPQILPEYYINHEIYIARVRKSGGSLEDIWNSLNNNIRNYEYSDTFGSEWNSLGAISISEALSKEKWDIVVVQQVSGLSGIAESFDPYLQEIIHKIRSINKDCIIAWQMTWSYASNSTHPDFKKYENDSHLMYEKIVETLKIVKPNVDIIIPSGTLIQELRKSKFSNRKELTEDGYHLSPGLPQYALSCLWIETLVSPRTGISCLGNNFREKKNIKVQISNESALFVFKLIKGLIP